MKIRHLILFVIFINVLQFNAQDKVVDSLLSELGKAKHDTTKLNIYGNLIDKINDENVWSKYNDQLMILGKKNENDKNEKVRRVAKRYIADALHNSGFLCNMKGEVDKAIDFYNQSIKVREELGDARSYATALNNLGALYKNKGDVALSLDYLNKALAIRIKDGYKPNLAETYDNIGTVYQDLGDIPKALECFEFSLKYYEESDSKKGIGAALANLAGVYVRQGDMDKAMQYYKRALKLKETEKDIRGLGLVLNNIGAAYIRAGQNDIALEYFKKSLKLREEVGDKKGIAACFQNLGKIYKSKKEYKEAIIYFRKSISIFKEIKHTKNLGITTINLAGLYLELASTPSLSLQKQININYASNLADTALIISNKLGFPEFASNVELLHSRIDSALGKGVLAYEHYKKYIFYRDSIQSEETRKASVRSQFKYEFDKKETILKDQQEAERNLAEEKSRFQQIIIWSIVGGLIMLIFFSISIFRNLQKNKRANKIITEQKKIVEIKNEIIEEKQREIIDSITYAKRLQDAILPAQDYIDKYFPENFVFYKPKDIVAGDFYWMEHLKDLTFIAVADSTGHGVPGAMVSVVCSNALNRATKEFGLIETGKILDKTRELVLETFSKSTSDVKDGMDISLLGFDHKKNSLTWSGANNQLYYLVNGQLKSIIPDKQPIGKTEHPKPFTTHSVQFEKGMLIYLMTDGYPDQFGGPKGKKYKYKQLENLLIENGKLELSIQRTLLEKEFESWKGVLEQVDDVTIVGIRM